MSISSSGSSWNPHDECGIAKGVKRVTFEAETEEDAVFLARLWSCIRRGKPVPELTAAVEKAHGLLEAPTPESRSITEGQARSIAVCRHWHRGAPCNTPVHPGYTICLRCKSHLDPSQIEAALMLPENASFRRRAASIFPPSRRLRKSPLSPSSIFLQVATVDKTNTCNE